jgi:hypothetical protein
LSDPKRRLRPAPTTIMIRWVTGRGYLWDVITSRELRLLAAEAPGSLTIDIDGRVFEDERAPEDAPVPGLIVGPVTEAVKLADEGSIVRHIDRDSLWAVEGFVLEDLVIDAIGDFSGTAGELIEAVAAAGYRWSALHLTHPL